MSEPVYTPLRLAEGELRDLDQDIARLDGQVKMLTARADRKRVKAAQVRARIAELKIQQAQLDLAGVREGGAFMDNRHAAARRATARLDRPRQRTVSDRRTTVIERIIRRLRAVVNLAPEHPSLPRLRAEVRRAGDMVRELDRWKDDYRKRKPGRVA